ncbi:hypothetical protein [Alkalihalobacillus sp. AL-G]|uniref:hypothetical protein n=1 Tax=Alkalihalobacillus sp. AL-G TaxID=2926399 RepID=UPI00272B5611|nr:hypothetical protein [Alkalihalobacillus sp. AL-G]WLD92588.1 hypothetical protein MOJ78_16445 [Alkalihalobacillus sp. AL-G]
MSNPALVFLIVIFGVIIISSLNRSLFKRNWQMIYTAFGYNDYIRVISRLKNHGVKYKTQIPTDLNSRERTFKDNTQYDIYVKKDDEHQAVNALHKTI